MQGYIALCWTDSVQLVGWIRVGNLVKKCNCAPRAETKGENAKILTPEE